MSKSAKLSQPKRAATNPSTAAERNPALSIIKDIQRQNRRQYTAEEKIRIVQEGLQGKQSVAEICRREGLNTNIYYRWIGPPPLALPVCKSPIFSDTTSSAGELGPPLG